MNSIFELILKIPGMIEFAVGVTVYVVVKWTAGQAVAGVAEETVCKLPDVMSKILCFILTNSLWGFICIVGTIVALGIIFRYTFFR